jgi:hypothetical protein
VQGLPWDRLWLRQRLWGRRRLSGGRAWLRRRRLPSRGLWQWLGLRLWGCSQLCHLLLEVWMQHLLWWGLHQLWWGLHQLWWGLQSWLLELGLRYRCGLWRGWGWNLQRAGRGTPFIMRLRPLY